MAAATLVENMPIRTPPPARDRAPAYVYAQEPLCVQIDAAKHSITTFLPKLEGYPITIKGLSETALRRAQRSGLFDFSSTSLPLAVETIDRFCRNGDNWEIKNSFPVISVHRTPINNTPLNQIKDYRYLWKGEKRVEHGFYTRKDLQTENGLKKIMAPITSSHARFCSVDWRAMGVGNEFGQREKITEFLVEVRSRVTTLLKDRGSLVVYGGDEEVWAFNDAEADLLIPRITQLISDIRDRYFPSDDPVLDQIRQAIEVREGTRELQKKARPFSANDKVRATAGFESLLKVLDTSPDQSFDKLGGTLRQAVEQASIAPLAQQAFGLALRGSIPLKQPVDNSFFLSFSMGCVTVDTRTTDIRDPLTVAKIVTQGFRNQMDSKSDVLKSTLFDPDIKLRQEDENRLRTAAQDELADSFLREAGDVLQSTFLGHTAISAIGIARLLSDANHTTYITRDNLARDVLLSEFGHQGIRKVVEIDLSIFRAFNNEYGYVASDEAFFKIARLASVCLPQALFIRSGGSLFAVAEKLNARVLGTLTELIFDEYKNEVVNEQSGNQAYFPYEISRAQRIWSSLYQAEDPLEALADPTIQRVMMSNFYEPNVFATDVAVDATTTVDQLIKTAQSSVQERVRPSKTGKLINQRK